ncbi:hypothetical protein GLAREA_09725 [Glarea lozoyensis ATCC 20868]|uniref:Uncharacterized protein n=1 Tax=Glarea lozoyensis (strain ATCC 20868 / MF5171) TaxID=1116229 RepID=S3CUB3_GLAL2|nr:uncharacterized protein GLAREA_09725 [Glarea lozoyensis ATCC 20868]EPE28604.1 hypothetical protein GLAREA_09725 [Glarea lozoyensis ATCC 20868]
MLLSIFSAWTVSLPLLWVFVTCAQSSGTQEPSQAADVENQLQSLFQMNLDEGPILLHETGQCPTSPKPGCSDPTCLGPDYISPFQFQCQATAITQREGRDVILAGCRCCPPQIDVMCDNHDCRAPEGSRTCISEELQGCPCDTTEDMIRRYETDTRFEDYVFYGEEEFEDIIEVNDDGMGPWLAAQSGQTRVNTPTLGGSFHLQNVTTQTSNVVALPTLNINHHLLRVNKDAPLDRLLSS